ncbi:MAG: transglycosylase SLT domain-containing protein [Candidatus Margulisbacteria bacterium]|nr:transglycosylase SLT domain-containing protein [Candidatus Margulisiibacteriota bacterium]
MRLKITIVSLLLLFSTPLIAQTIEGGVVDFAAALRARAAGSPEAAVSLLRKSLADDKFSLRDYAQFEIAETFYNSADYLSAIPEYKSMSSNYPKSLLLPQADLMLGKSFFNAKDYPAAVKTFRDLLAIYPEAKEAPEARYLIARAFEQQNKWQAAYLAYEETDLNHPLSFFGKKSRLAIAALKKAHRKKLPKFKATAAALFKKGMTYFERDDFETSGNIFNRLAREFPKSKYVGEAWLMLGRAEMQTDSPAAISDLERAAQGAPNLAGRATYYLGLAYGRRGNYDKAIEVLKRIPARYPESDLADEACYWAAYYKEQNGDSDGALREYYDLINNYPYSKSVPAAIWRIGKTYYWNSDFKNAAVYLHLAQLYPPGEDTPRCYFFEAKALERQGNKAAAAALYEKLAGRFDHSYYAYRAREKLNGLGPSLAEQSPFNDEDFSQALSELDAKNQAGLAAIMEIWEQTRIDAVRLEGSQEVQAHLAKYKELMNLGITDYAADEARYLVNLTSDVEKDSAQTRLGEMLMQSGEYRTPIRFADRKVKEAILAGKPASLPKKIWQLAYPRGYWGSVAAKADSFGLDPYLVLAVIREESRFNARAVSRSGARGLMQIMPRTGRGIAKDLDKARFRTKKLFEPALNIEMGTYYLSNLVKNFNGNFYLSLAGYNGGPNKIKRYVKSWYNDNLGSVDIDEFIESIPVRETRLYVQKVMGSYFEYKRLYERKRG